MDIDEQPPPRRSLDSGNAAAGPSTLSDTPAVFLPPPGPPQPPLYFTSTQDLLARFQLLPAYDKYVRPFAIPAVPGTQQPGAIPSATDKSKGKEKELPIAALPVHFSADANDGDDEDGGKGEKKFKNYKHMIKGIPGKHSMKKDDYLTTMIQIPPKQKSAITPFDTKTQREAFSVSLEGLKGWNINTLVAESPQAREDRKKRKEAKKAAKAQAQISAMAIVGTPSALPATPAPTTGSMSGGPILTSAPARTATPRPTAATISKPPPTHTQPPPPRGPTPAGIGTVNYLPTPGPGPGPPNTNGAPVQSVPDANPRGVKRERDNSGDALHANGNVPPHVSLQRQEQYQVQDGGAQPVFIKGAKAGNAGVRPRPAKRQRLDGKGQAPMPIQQPTPHA